MNAILKVTKLTDLLLLLHIVHIPWWFSCSNSCDVTVNDIDLIKELHAFKKVDRIMEKLH